MEKLIVAALQSTWIGWTGAFRAYGGDEAVHLECEAFESWGGWVNDTQFMDQMGSPYLLAHGLGRPVENARTTFSVGQSGDYFVTARTKNWTAPWSEIAAGRFRILVDGKILPNELGVTGKGEWTVETAGKVSLSKGTHTLELQDLTGFDGRCDWIEIKSNPSAVVPCVETEVAYSTNDIVVVGGGIAGITAAISAARLGLTVALVQDRPVLGGNNSSEVRVHLGGWQNKAPYPRLGDVVAEIGPKSGGNAQPAEVYEDDRKLAAVRAEKNISLFLNTRANAVELSPDGAIASVSGVDTRTGRRTAFAGRWFVDATGDGTVGYLAGADYRMGREAKSETGEAWAPEKADGMTMGASVQWYAGPTKDGRASAFPCRPWMLAFTDENAHFDLRGDWDWEAGLGRDQSREAEYIRDYGLLVAYSNWAFVKNRSKRVAEFATNELKWVAYNAGRRESRRLLGDYVLSENDIDARTVFNDGTCATTWTIDLHWPMTAAETKFAGEPFRSDSRNKVIWPIAIPYRCCYSRNRANLFMVGRNISVTHIALGTTRLMRTHGMMGEVVGMAAALCKKHDCRPRQIYERHLDELKDLMGKGVGDGRGHPVQMYNIQTSLDPDFIPSQAANGQILTQSGNDDGEGCVISLAGEWRFALGTTNPLTDTIFLPTTTDIARKGDGKIGGQSVERIHPQLIGADLAASLTMHPMRRRPFVGVAQYERSMEIPESWEGKRMTLFLERTKIVRAFLDGVSLGRRETFAAPAVFELPRTVKPGRHVLRLEVDNRIDAVPVSGHQVSEDTQTNWNGILGRIELRAEGLPRFGRIRLFPNPSARTVDVEAEVFNPDGVSTNRQTVALAKDAALWSEFSPVLHEIEVRVGDLSRRMKVGLREFRTRGTQFTVNGRPTFLRGRHDACVWPLTGAAPMDVESWRSYFRTVKDYGLNHVRFHSWCPPDAAFQAADELGFYLQPELPFFGGDWTNPQVSSFALDEAKRILDAYGNHPSFVMFSLGNEPTCGGDARVEVAQALRAYDPRPLYAQGSNADYSKPHRYACDDFWCTFRSTGGAEGNVRGSYSHCDLPLGDVQLAGRGTVRDFSSAVAHSSVPLIGHETGQYQAYPDYSEIAKYTGVLEPLNLKIFRERLVKAGLADRADDFHRASGALLALNYREDVEMALRTPGFGGFQLLDLQDFPGQGTALVGILNVFMESKGFISPEKWREFCAPTVLLARYPASTLTEGDAFGADIQIAHYGKEDVLTGVLAWRLVDSSGKALSEGVLPVSARVGEVAAVGTVAAKLPVVGKAEKLSLELELVGRGERNAYPLWVYPKPAPLPEVRIVHSLEEGERLLDAGETGLCILSGKAAPTNAVPGFFAADFWNWPMFKFICESNKRLVAPGTLGLLIDPGHPALDGFPTSCHSDQQWRNLILKGVNVVLDDDPSAHLIVQGIDNFARNRRLGVIWEKRRGKGRLVVSAIDLEACADLPEARALRAALVRYVDRLGKSSVVSSPNGRVGCEFFLRDGVTVARVSYDGRHAFESELGFKRGKLVVQDSSERTVKEAWKPVWGFKSEYPDRYTELTVNLAAPDSPRTDEVLTLRCYDEGFAVRAKTYLNVYELGEIRDERTSWRFATGAKAWCIPGTESTFPENPHDLDALDSANAWRMPFTVELPNGCAASILEADVRDYPRSYLNVAGGVIRPSFAIGVKEGRGEIVSPWRAVQLAPNAGKLIETAYFIENLNEPCAIADTSWIQPGLSVSDAGNCELVTERVIDAARAAKRCGAKYFQMDWGWYGTEYAWSDNDRATFRTGHPEFADDTTWEANTYADPYSVAKGTVPYHPWWPYDCHRRGVDLDIPRIVAELKKMGMGLGLYVHGAVLEANDLDRLFATYASWGVVALKPGFVSFGSQKATEWMRALAATAAKHRLWLDIHDAQIPDGFERTYPSVMLSEGGGGEEGNHPARQDVALPFTRCLSGPFDFTPRLFNPDGLKKGTKVHEVALFLCYPGPAAVMRGDVRKLLETDASVVEFLKALPWNYDDTRVLDAAIARHLVVARRRGENWYLAGMTGEKEYMTEFLFDFLPDGREFTLRLWRDDFASESRPRGYVCETRCVRKGDSLAVPMARCGGFLALIERP